MLLFLQSVKQVEVRVQCSGSDDVVRLGGSSLHTACAMSSARLRAERQLFIRAQEDGTVQTHRAAFTVSIEADVPCEIEGSGTMHKASSWLLVMRVEPVTEEAEDLEIPRHRYAAVAMRLTSAAFKDSLSRQVPCFSPLALQTGFPAHASANFR